MNTTTLGKTTLEIDHDASVLRDIVSWFLDLDPVHVARRHLGLAVLWLSVGLLSSLLLRLELMTPDLDAVQARTFGVLLSLHGFLLIYFVALPIFPGVLGHLVLARWMPEGRLAFPRLSRLSWHLLAVGGCLITGAFLTGGTEIGWSFDAEFGGRFDQPGTAPVALGVLLASISVSVMGLNALASLQMLRRTGLPSGGARIVAESIRGASILSMVVGPLLGMAMALVLADSCFHLSLFAPELGGDPRLFVLLFRFFFGPAQIMLLLLAVGMSLGVVAERSRAVAFRRWPGYGCALMLIAAFVGWGAEIWSFGSGQPIAILAGQPCALLIIAAFLILFALALRFLRSGVTTFDTALIYALGFFVTAAQGLGVGLLMASPMGGVQFGNTQLASAQMHLMMIAVLGMALLGGLHAEWSRLTGHTFSEPAGRFLALLVIIGTQLAFSPLLILGLKGASYRANAYPAEFQVWQVMATAGSTVLLAGLVLAIFNLVVGRKALPGAMVRPLMALVVFAALSTGCRQHVPAQPETLQLKITGMHCEGCAESITRKLQSADGILASDVHFSNEVQTVHYDAARTKEARIVAVITNLGFSAVAAVP